MRTLLFFLATTALAQPAPQSPAPTTESLRGASAVSRNVAWASGTHGTYLRTTDAGRTWIPAQVTDAATLDFRAVVAFSADEAFLMSAGPGNQSRIYHTTDAGRTWQLQFTNTNPKGFFDSMVFWDRTHGIVLGDPIADETGNETGNETGKDTSKLKFELLITNDGQTWTPIPPAQLPPAIEGEGAFAASNSCIAILPSKVNSPPLPKSASAPRKPSGKKSASAPDGNIWFATGGRAARVFHSSDRGQTWQVFDTPILHGPDSAGIFSIAFRDQTNGVIAGGDYKHPDQDGPNLAFTTDAGKTWTVAPIFPQSYYSAVAYDLKDKTRLFLVGSKSVYDLRPPKTLIPNNSGNQYSALSPYPTGGAQVVGPKGAIAIIH